MSPAGQDEDGVRLARRFTGDLWDKGRYELAREIFSADFIDRQPLADQKPGLDGYLAMVASFRTAFPDLRVRNEDVIVAAGGAKVALRWSATGTHKGPIGTIPPTGKAVRLHGMDILAVRDGLIAERWGEFDALGMMQQLGVVADG